jgi:predicted nucleic acid-binding protein
MIDTYFLDTNVIIEAFSSNHYKVNIAKKLLNQHPTISTQVINEFISVCLKKLKINRQDTYFLANELLTHCKVMPVDSNTVRQAMIISQRYNYSHWDCLIIATALQSGCSILYSEDMQNEQLIGNLKIINPFQNKENF